MNKLGFQVVAFIAVVVALVWAKKNVFDSPKLEAEAVPVHTTNSPLPKGLSVGHDIAPPPSEPAAQPSSEPLAPSSGKDEDNAISNLIHKFTGGAKIEDRARVRMKAFMQAWKEGGTSLNDAEQAAACLFSRGKLFIPDRDEIQDAYNGFVAFRKARNLYTNITDYSVGDVRPMHDDLRGDYCEVDVTINNFPYTIGVPDKPNPLFWVR